MKANTTGFKIYRSHKSGSIIYNGHTLNEFFACKGLPAYISQTDHHLSELIVRETLDFAARCQGASEAFSGRMRELLQLEKEKDIHTSQKLMLLRRLCIGLHDIFNYLLWLELLLGVICIEAFQVVKQRGSLQVRLTGFVAGTTFLRTWLHPTDETYWNLYLSCLLYRVGQMMYRFSELSLTITGLPLQTKR